MQAAERWVGVIVTLMSGSLVFLLAGCTPERKGPVTDSGPSERTETPAVKAGSESPPPAKAFVANPFCKACHLDFDEEKLVKIHERAGIGCERCHGESLRHRSDEANVTPPEIMYPKERINPTCMMCHPRQMIQQVEKHRPILEAGLSIFEEATPAGPDAKKYCTDCHGAHHRMTVRTVQWDKCTGKLLQKGN